MSTLTLLRADFLTPIQLSVRSECYINTPYHLKSHNSICIFKDTGSPSNIFMFKAGKCTFQNRLNITSAQS